MLAFVGKARIQSIADESEETDVDLHFHHIRWMASANSLRMPEHTAASAMQATKAMAESFAGHSCRTIYQKHMDMRHFGMMSKGIAIARMEDRKLGNRYILLNRHHVTCRPHQYPAQIRLTEMSHVYGKENSIPNEVFDMPYW
jgi:hypothetical protein